MSVRGWYFAHTYDRQMRKVETAGLAALRRELLAEARGSVLEIGAGTGGNLDVYASLPAVTSVVLTEPETSLVRLLEKRATRLTVPVTVLRAPAEDLPFDDGSFDVVVSTLVLCGVDDQPRALREARRVLRPDGCLLFLEHVRSLDPVEARRQRRMNPVNRLVMGCECTRPTLDAIPAAGFHLDGARHLHLPQVPSFVRPAVVGRASVQTS